nr:MAG TPA: hypothetical protein [Caudoviricetes sp.]
MLLLYSLFLDIDAVKPLIYKGFTAPHFYYSLKIIEN